MEQHAEDSALSCVRRYRHQRIRLLREQLKASKKDKAHTILAGKMIDGRLMSASKPNQSLPDVNHFVIALCRKRGTVMKESSGVLADVLSDGTRRTALASAADSMLNIEGADMSGDLLNGLLRIFYA